MKEVNVYVKESWDGLHTQEGSYIVLLSTQGKELVFSRSFCNTTNYRLIIQGSIDAIKKLNQPCVINLYTNTNFGMSKIRNSKGEWRKNTKGGINTELLDELRNLLIEGRHEINNFYDKNIVAKEIIGKFKDDDGEEQHLPNDEERKYMLINLSFREYEKLLEKSMEHGLSVKSLISSILKGWIKEHYY